MKRSNPIARTTIALAAALVLAFGTGCDQQGGQLAQLTESFNKKIEDKEKELKEARAAQQLASNQKSELEGKLQALQSELDKARASTPTGSSNGPAISTEKLSAEVAALLEPMIRKSVQEAVDSLPKAPAHTAANPPANPPNVADVRTPRNPKDPKGEPPRPLNGSGNKIPIEFPPLNSPR